MTPRSPTQQPQPKTTTISRRLRNRADQHLSVQPPELPQLRGLRSRRAATLPSNRRTSTSYPVQEAYLNTWNANLDNILQRSTTSHPADLAHSNLLLQEALDIATYQSPSDASTALVSIQPGEPESYQVQPSSPADLLPSPLPSLSGSHTATEFDYSESPHDPSLELQDMSTLGFMMAPAPYGMEHHYGSPPNMESPSKQWTPPQSYTDTKSSTSASYAPTYTASPSMHGQPQSRRSTESSVMPPYQPSLPRSPYQQSMGPTRTSPTPMNYGPNSEPSPMLSSAPQAYSYPAVHSSLPAAALGSNTPNYPPPPLYPPSSYGMSDYTPLPTTLYPSTTSPAPYPSYEHSPHLAPHSAGAIPGSTPSQNQTNGPMPRILNSRPKPQCWEHGCNGRQFSTFSNLLRHQREKSGTAAKSYCPRCGAEFTRTTARNGHMAHEKCKARRTSDSNR
ncbi:uncharacterized protein CC84DRAFT_1188816 [Paraphaeosphaeria sporulosa]|uniref:C2H2-type domain-containing protein n=1 Tax=Paraphaeosphaeria sporulosa TaxID=1460663 RepID=A0A177C722_9PLEO|nr:uncharacterized protein CC84DRAFT_1188816 [Paraphaeosphaeria sporulosa]OAG02669.1 hypothetical protein CC84DRAFT_1188816 [Paraphaeosphaeria sporulosa]